MLDKATAPHRGYSQRLAREIRARIALEGLTQTQFAVQIGMAPSSLSRKLNGTTPFTVTELAAMARALHTPPAELLRRAEGAV